MDTKKWVLIIIGVIVLIGLSLIPFERDRISLAKEYIAKNTLETGQFVYRNNLNNKVHQRSNSYTELRHADVLYSMYIYEKYSKDVSLKEQRLLASKYFVEKNILNFKDGMWVATAPSMSRSAKLGSAGLALASLSNLYKTNSSYASKLDGMGKFIVYMQKPDGSFYHKVNLQNGQFNEKTYVVYYPGEAVLGLLSLNEVSPNKLWVTTAKKALMHTVTSDQKLSKKTPFDAWTVMAIRKMFETKDNQLTPKDEIILKKYVEHTTKAMLQKQITEKSDRNYGGFEDNTKLGSTALILEGLESAYYITDNEKLKEHITTSLEIGSKFLSKYQIKNGKYKGGIPSDIRWRKSESKSYSQIRMDNVQRALTVWALAKNIK